jgi:hypothetical protein
LNKVVVAKLIIKVNRVNGTVAVINIKVLINEEADVIIVGARFDKPLDVEVGVIIKVIAVAGVAKDDDVIINTVKTAVDIVAVINDGRNVKVVDLLGLRVMAGPAGAETEEIMLLIIVVVAVVDVEVTALKRN